jgi:hypothetical protein
MDAQHHATIVDKLMQYRGKIPKNGHLGNKNAQVQAYMLRMNVEHLIKMIDAFAVADEKGLIR